MTPKERAAVAAAGLISNGMVVGLGTGSTAAVLVREVGRLLRAWEIRDIRGVPTSESTARLARAEGIPLVGLDEVERVDLTLDGADEVDPAWNLVKGAGGSLLREKIVAQASAAEAIMVDSSKLVERLGSKMPLPVEVVPFGWTTHLEFFRSLGGAPKLRKTADGAPFLTDEGNYTVDLWFTDGSGTAALEDPHRLERNLLVRTGVVETGLFLGLATILVIGGETGVEIRRERPA